jgi:hypothetical protein
MKILHLAVLVISVISVASAASWSGYIKTSSDSWSIVRESSNLSFTYMQSVEGIISPVDYRGRTLSPYHSFYEDAIVNDVRVKERTAALEGSYSSEELLNIESSLNNSVNLTIEKPAGTDVYTIDFYEIWPVKLNSSKSIKYIGKGINNRDFVGNNQDFVGANFLYSQDFSKERTLNMSLEKMNATILATDEGIDSAVIKATRDTHYRLQAHSTGVSNFKYRQTGADGTILNAGDERFVGNFDIAKDIRMKSRFDEHETDDDWLPCCFGGYLTMPTYYQKAPKGFGSNVKAIFDCNCWKQPGECATTAVQY